MNASSGSEDVHRYAVVVAGGAGTRLWPLSRANLPKQMHSLLGERSLIYETVERIRGVVPAENIYVSTTANYSSLIVKHLPQIPEKNVIVEPVARGTAAAFALFTHTLHERDRNAVIFTLASDHKVAETDRFRQTLRTCFEFIERNPDHIGLVGITPTRPDTGLGYVKVRSDVVQAHPTVLAVEKFVEKPSQSVAAAYVDSGDYYWSAGYYCYRAKTLLDAYTKADTGLVEAAQRYADSHNIDDYLRAPQKLHEIELIDSHEFPLALIPADFKWSDIGNWQALLLAQKEGSKPEQSAQANLHIDVGSVNSDVRAEGSRVVATVGVSDVTVHSNDEVATVWIGNTLIVAMADAILVIDGAHHGKLPQVLEVLRAQEMINYL
jgi:mannose-1-phosphate guanylyltransferase